MPTTQPTKRGPPRKRYTIESEHNGWKDLQDPDPAQKLEIDRVLGRQKDNEHQGAQFDYERNNFGNGCLFRSG